ncbi:HAUS augmin-like complex subunit 8 [Orycteropus afer afer]|uniref:HAUS augmin-like complex subunit 8 n=1 Tax=Orycteropus afer afer TaxID=1230840 RepID=A0AC54Z9C5_ORYAF|nr:HAUS augmin-like complex subunit 8 [Orycteropus afer afer]
MAYLDGVLDHEGHMMDKVVKSEKAQSVVNGNEPVWSWAGKTALRPGLRLSHQPAQFCREAYHAHSWPPHNQPTFKPLDLCHVASTWKPLTAGSNTPSGAKPKGKRVQGGRMVEPRYLQYEKKTTKKVPAADALKTSGKMLEGGKKSNSLQKSRGASDMSVVAKGELQSTMLEGHGAAPPDLDLSAINDKSMVRKTPQLQKTLSQQNDSSSFSSSRKKSPDLSESMDMMESQTLLLTLVTVKMENSLSQLEEKAENNLLNVCREQEKLQKKVQELRRRQLLGQRTRELLGTLDAQAELLGPFEALAGLFKEQYRTFAAALDSTRHELPVTAIHLEGGSQQFLDDLQKELVTTRCLLSDLGANFSEESVKALDFLSELKDVTVKKDLELQRSFGQVLELSAEVSKEAALINQGVWEEAQGPRVLSQWYFHHEGDCGEPRGEDCQSRPLLGHSEPCAL